MIINYLDTDNRQNSDFKVLRKRGLPEYLFVLFKSHVNIVFGERSEVAAPGTCILFDKNMPQNYAPTDGAELFHDFIEFDTENEYENTLISRIPKGKIIPLSFPEVITRALSDIKAERYASISAYKKEIMSNLGQVFLYRLCDESECFGNENKRNPHFKAFHELRAGIYNNPTDAPTVSDASRRLCLSRPYFQHMYKEFFSVSFMSDVISARISYAKHLLFSTCLPISEIALKCGYASTEHFIKQFCKFVGTSPNRFRNSR